MRGARPRLLDASKVRGCPTLPLRQAPSNNTCACMLGLRACGRPRVACVCVCVRYVCCACACDPWCVCACLCSRMGVRARDCVFVCALVFCCVARIACVARVALRNCGVCVVCCVCCVLCHVLRVSRFCNVLMVLFASHCVWCCVRCVSEKCASVIQTTRK